MSFIDHRSSIIDHQSYTKVSQTPEPNAYSLCCTSGAHYSHAIEAFVSSPRTNPALQRSLGVIRDLHSLTSPQSTPHSDSDGHADGASCVVQHSSRVFPILIARCNPWILKRTDYMNRRLFWVKQLWNMIYANQRCSADKQHLVRLHSLIRRFMVFGGDMDVGGIFSAATCRRRWKHPEPAKPWTSHETWHSVI